jgi:hypothetical protein
VGGGAAARWALGACAKKVQGGRRKSGGFWRVWAHGGAPCSGAASASAARQAHAPSAALLRAGLRSGAADAARRSRAAAAAAEPACAAAETRRAARGRHARRARAPSGAGGVHGA